MKRTLLVFLFAILLSLATQAQFITHGPVFGGVGPDSLRVYLRTGFALNYTIEYSTDASFSSGVQTLNASSDPLLDNSAVTTLHGLSPALTYHFRFRFNGTLDSIQGVCRTFPLPGTKSHYVITAGSCQETANMNVFLEIPNHNPDIFLHLGDWTYPAYQLPDNYPEDRAMVELSWRRKYEEINMREMLHGMPVDHVYDDDDFTEGGSTRNHYVPEIIDSTVFLSTYHRIVEVYQPDSVRRNVIKGYTDFFPHYGLVDTSEGVFHKFSLGNTEVFFLDTRATASPPTTTLVRDPQTALYSFAPTPDNTLLRQVQMDWLLQGLQNSSADWKIICMGNVFNQSEKRYIDWGLQQQLLNIPGIGSPFSFATAFSNNWSGYPGDSRKLLCFIDSLQIKDVFVLSGQSHNNVVDNGTNAGLPELNASGLSVADLSLSQQMQALSLFGLPPLGDSLWNGGGNGVGNNNLNNGFGKVDIYGADSARLSAVDELGEVMGSVLLIHSSQYVAAQKPAETLDWEIFPIPASEKIQIQAKDLKGVKKYRLINPFGAEVLKGQFNHASVELQVSQFAAGIYHVVLEYNGERHTQRIVLLPRK